MSDQPVRLKALLRERHWQTFSTFCREYNKAAARVDRDLVGTAPSRPQFHRWLSGELTRLPHSHHCQILEAMLPGWTARQLFESYDEATQSMSRPSINTGQPTGAVSARPSRHADVEDIYSSRAEFAAKVPPEALFDDASTVRASGLSLNLLCQSYSDKQWRTLIENDGQLDALFLEPRGKAISAREAEEGFDEGHLSALTDLNIQTLLRLRNRLPSHLQDRVRIATYDETIRFNIILVDDHLCVVQPYLPDTRGVDSPTLVIRRQSPVSGLYPTFESVFNSLWERRRER